MSARIKSVELPFLAERKHRHCCVWCGVDLPKGSRRQRWCGQKCVTTYQIARGDQGAARRWLEFGPDHVWPSDDNPLRCALCSRDVSRAGIRKWREEHRAAGRYSLDCRWEADHIVPLVEGGARTPDNLRALCRPCHLAETKALRGRMAARRREAEAVTP